MNELGISERPGAQIADLELAVVEARGSTRGGGRRLAWGDVDRAVRGACRNAAAAANGRRSGPGAKRWGESKAGARWRGYAR